MVHALIFTLKYGHTSSSLMLSLFGPSIFQVGTWFVIFLDSIQYHNDFVFTLISFSFYEICRIETDYSEKKSMQYQIAF